MTTTIVHYTPIMRKILFLQLLHISITQEPYNSRHLDKQKKTSNFLEVWNFSWWRRTDSNRGHCGYEPHALANWATPPMELMTRIELVTLSLPRIRSADWATSAYEVGCGGRTWTTDLRVMSPTSYQLLHPAMKVGGWGWIRTNEAKRGRFTVCSL